MTDKDHVENLCNTVIIGFNQTLGLFRSTFTNKELVPLTPLIIEVCRRLTDKGSPFSVPPPLIHDAFLRLLEDKDAQNRLVTMVCDVNGMPPKNDFLDSYFKEMILTDGAVFLAASLALYFSVLEKLRQFAGVAQVSVGDMAEVAVLVAWAGTNREGGLWKFWGPGNPIIEEGLASRESKQRGLKNANKVRKENAEKWQALAQAKAAEIWTSSDTLSVESVAVSLMKKHGVDKSLRQICRAIEKLHPNPKTKKTNKQTSK